jgi:DNA primase
MRLKRFSDAELHKIRNDLPVRTVIEELLKLPSKEVEGLFRFLCPCCNEFQTAIHPRENLGRCFRCQRNFNTIELVMKAQELDFVASVKFLQRYLQAAFNKGLKVPVNISLGV